MHRMFFYGTLMSGLWNNTRFLRNAKLVGTARTGAEFDLRRNSMIPFVTRGNKVVVGEVWDVPDDEARAVHELEVHAGYVAKTITVTLDNGEVVKASIYTIARPGVYDMAETIENGDYRSWITEQNYYKEWRAHTHGRARHT